MVLFNLRNFKILNLISFDNNRLIFEFIPHNIQNGEAIDKGIIDSIFEFQNLKLDLLWVRVTSIFFEPYLGLMRLCFVSVTKGFILFKYEYFKIVLDILLKTKKQKISINVHKDFRKFENVIEVENQIFILDYESFIYSKRWVLLDIIDYSFNPTTYEINNKLIIQFWMKYYSSLSIEEVILHIKLSCLRKALSYLIYNFEDRINRQEMISFVKNIILDEKSFIRWTNIK